MMLAEMLMVRLEAVARVSDQAIPVSSNRFVPFIASNQFAFKDERVNPANRLLEAAHEKASPADPGRLCPNTRSRKWPDRA
jgi:hypothetical protein